MIEVLNYSPKNFAEAKQNGAKSVAIVVVLNDGTVEIEDVVVLFRSDDTYLGLNYQNRLFNFTEADLYND